MPNTPTHQHTNTPTLQHSNTPTLKISKSMTISEQLISAARELSNGVDKLSFSSPITHVYNPLDYAWRAHQAYLQAYGCTKKRVLFLGMNPGPFGMVQTAVPFGEIMAVRDWMNLHVAISKPNPEHPKRPVDGFNCKRSEISGQRLWRLFANRYPDPKAFFAQHFVLNYCPLAFMEKSGRNRTPDKLPIQEMAPVYEACDRHLEKVANILEPKWLIGVGQFAYKCLQRIKKDTSISLGSILHPSPASPAANQDWAGKVTKQLRKLGIW